MAELHVGVVHCRSCSATCSVTTVIGIRASGDDWYPVVCRVTRFLTTSIVQWDVPLAATVV